MPPPKVHPQLAHLAGPVTELRGVGAERAAMLARLGIHTVADLLLHRPRRYEDRRRIRPIRQAALGEAAIFCGKVTALGIKRYSQGAKSVFELVLDDGTARLHCRWWNLPYMQNYFTQGDEVLVFGKPLSLRPRTIDHPETEVVENGEERSVHLNRIAPVYPLTEGLPQRWLRGVLWRAVEQFAPTIQEPWPALVATGSLGATEALRALHFPSNSEDAEAARRRFALEEFLALQISIRERRQTLQARAKRASCGGDNRLIKPFLATLPFKLTRAQTKVLREIRQDMSSGEPMRRLLQGDVGSGKTVVAAGAALMALESGFNVALMAPTEILALQHFETFRRWFEPLKISVLLRTGSHKESKHPSQKTEPPSQQEPGSAGILAGEASPARLDGMAPGAPSTVPETKVPESDSKEASASAPTFIIGTHALIEESFEMDRLGLVIIDEQHKFGVTQRERLVRKGSYPHLLVMTATPIPRTLGLTVYGDLDSSVIDELPTGRASVRTFVRDADRLPKVWDFIRAKLREGRQAYIVYPRIEDAGTGGLKAVTKEWEILKRELAPFQVGLLHGRVKASDKEQVMADFHARKIHVLLATPLIEVGVDVPNASVMLIENAEQFGLAQLHQLRGRIGRGAHESFCILVAAAKTDEARQRLEILAGTADGFQIAEADLKLRGPGDFLGQQQSGLPPLRFGNLAEDLALIETARRLAAQAGTGAMTQKQV